MSLISPRLMEYIAGNINDTQVAYSSLILMIIDKN